MTEETEEIQDDELQGLLDQLDENDDLVVEAMKSESGCPKGEPGDKGEPGKESVLDTSNVEEAVKPADELHATDARKFEGDQLTTQNVTEENVPNIQVQKYMDKLDDVTDEVLAACRSDRQEAQDVIGIYKKAVEDAVTGGKPPARMWVDGLVKAVEVKAGINGNAVKIIEANAKMLAATKAGSINTQVNVGGNDNLDDVLAEELGDQDGW